MFEKWCRMHMCSVHSIVSLINYSQDSGIFFFLFFSSSKKKSITQKLCLYTLDQYLFCLHDFFSEPMSKNSVFQYFCKVLEGTAHYQIHKKPLQCCSVAARKFWQFGGFCGSFHQNSHCFVRKFPPSVALFSRKK